MTATMRLRAPRGPHEPQVSRDYAADDVKCRVSYCPCNDRKGHCTLPSQIDIRADGVCQKSVDFKPKANPQ